jgi:hypothetical protein
MNAEKKSQKVANDVAKSIKKSTGGQQEPVPSYDCSQNASFDCSGEYNCNHPHKCSGGYNKSSTSRKRGNCTNKYECDSSSFSCNSGEFNCGSKFKCNKKFTG